MNGIDPGSGELDPGQKVCTFSYLKKDWGPCQPTFGCEKDGGKISKKYKWWETRRKEFADNAWSVFKSVVML